MLLEEVKNFVDQAFKGKQKPHFERTLHWVLQFRPDADVAFQIAAYAHDIERGFRRPEENTYEKSDKGYRDEEFLRHHQERGAEIMREFLESRHADEAIIRRVTMLISRHEVGGNPDQDLLKDCDSVSFFETNAEMFVKEKARLVGKEKVREKFDWMFNRISSREAGMVAEPLYRKACVSLSMS